MVSHDTLRVISWNVNGIRSCAKKGFVEWLDRTSPFILGIQEVRAHPDQLPASLRNPVNWWQHIVCAERKGYSGVAAYAREEPDTFDEGVGNTEFDVEGRVQFLRYGKLVVANVYFPNGNGKNRDNSRVSYKLRFYDTLRQRLEKERNAGMHVLVMGDFNTAHKGIDLARPKSNQKTSGFLPCEREVLDEWVAAGWVDTFRIFHQGPENYSWWSQRGGCRERNVGWRIDYVFAAPEAVPYIQDGFIMSDVMGSDHCPVGVNLSPDIL